MGQQLVFFMHDPYVTPYRLWLITTARLASEVHQFVGEGDS